MLETVALGATVVLGAVVLETAVVEGATSVEIEVVGVTMAPDSTRTISGWLFGAPQAGKPIRPRAIVPLTIRRAIGSATRSLRRCSALEPDCSAATHSMMLAVHHSARPMPSAQHIPVNACSAWTTLEAFGRSATRAAIANTPKTLAPRDWGRDVTNFCSGSPVGDCMRCM